MEFFSRRIKEFRCISTENNSQRSDVQTQSTTPTKFPTSGRQTGCSYIASNGVAVPRSFIYDYLVDHISPNETQPTNNFRALKVGYNLFASGYVQSVSMCRSTSHCFYKGTVLPTMKYALFYAQ